MAIIVPDDGGGVDVGEPVKLRGAEEANVDPPGLQPVVENLGDAESLSRSE